MAKGIKSDKKRVTTSFRLDPYLLATAKKICRKLSDQQDKDVSLSSMLENFVEGWVKQNRHILSKQ